MKDESTFSHISVLSDELIHGLNPRPGECVIDCTAGGGGHLSLMLERIGPTGKLVALDRDPDACAEIQKKFSAALSSGVLTLVQKPFATLYEIVQAQDLLGKIDIIYADIGVSSFQIDTDYRGFSFRLDGPLDMRMDPTLGTTAADLVNEEDEQVLTRIFRDYGEEPKAKYFARKIVLQRQLRPFATTGDLANFLSDVNPYHHSKKHPGTKIFQALRIAVNDEINQLKRLIPQAFDALKPKGRLGIITFHSIEDRVVKQAFRSLASVATPPKGIPITEDQLPKAAADIVRPFPYLPSEEEISRNARARSAKLRIIRKTTQRSTP